MWLNLVVGVEHVGGDMFVSVPKADAIFMKMNFCILVFFFIFYYLFILFLRRYITFTLSPTI